MNQKNFLDHPIISPYRDAISFCFPAWIISRILLAVWGTAIWFIKIPLSDDYRTYIQGIKIPDTGIAVPLLGYWLRWDVSKYLKIAQFGYISDDLSAFFPFFPLLGRIVGWLTGNNFLLGLMVVSNVSLLIALILLYQVSKDYFSKDIAQKTIILLLAWPGAYYLYTGYPHSLLLCLSLAAFVFAKNKQWLACSVTAFLAGLTHSTAIGLFFLLGAMIYPIKLKRFSWKELPVYFVPVFPVLGIVLFFAWRIHQGFPDFTTLQLEIWDKHSVWPWQTIMIIKNNISHITLSMWVNLLCFCLAIGLIPLIWKKMSAGLALFTLSIVLEIGSVVVGKEPMPSMVRYILSVFPFFIGLSYLSRKWFKPVFVVFIALQFIYCGAFLIWVWVA